MAESTIAPPSGAAEQAGCPSGVRRRRDRPGRVRAAADPRRGILLRHVIPTLRCPPARVSGDADGSARRCQLSEQDLEQRRLSGAVGPSTAMNSPCSTVRFRSGPQRALTERQQASAQFDGGGYCSRRTVQASASDCAVAVCHCTNPCLRGASRSPRRPGCPRFSAFSRMFSVTLPRSASCRPDTRTFLSASNCRVSAIDAGDGSGAVLDGAGERRGGDVLQRRGLQQVVREGSVCAIGASRWAAAMPAVVSDTWRSRRGTPRRCGCRPRRPRGRACRVPRRSRRRWRRTVGMVVPDVSLTDPCEWPACSSADSVAWVPVRSSYRSKRRRRFVTGGLQDVLDELVVTAAVEDHQGRVGDLRGVGRTGLVGVRVGRRFGDDRGDLESVRRRRPARRCPRRWWTRRRGFRRRSGGGAARGEGQGCEGGANAARLWFEWNGTFGACALLSLLITTRKIVGPGPGPNVIGNRFRFT